MILFQYLLMILAVILSKWITGFEITSLRSKLTDDHCLGVRFVIRKDRGVEIHGERV